MLGLMVRSVTWNRFLIFKNLLVDSGTRLFGLGIFRSDYEILQNSYMFAF